MNSDEALKAFENWWIKERSNFPPPHPMSFGVSKAAWLACTEQRDAYWRAVVERNMPEAVAALKEHMDGGMWTWEGAVQAALRAALKGV